MLIWSSYSACINLKLHYYIYIYIERERERDVNESQSKNNVTENRETILQGEANILEAYLSQKSSPRLKIARTG